MVWTPKRGILRTLFRSLIFVLLAFHLSLLSACADSRASAERPVNESSAHKSDVTIDLTCDMHKGVESIKPELFGFDSAVFPPGLGALRGSALRNFKLLNTDGAFTSISTRNFEPEKGKINGGPLDSDMKECDRLKLIPLLRLNELFGILCCRARHCRDS
jgi:hypothetical protein